MLHTSGDGKPSTRLAPLLAEPKLRWLCICRDVQIADLLALSGARVEIANLNAHQKTQRRRQHRYKSDLSRSLR